MPTILLPYHVDDAMPGLDRLVPDAVEIEATPGTGDVWTRLVPLYAALADAVAEEATAGPVTVVSGGCNASAGVVAGLQRAGLDPVVVWFDAHGDMQTLETTTSGYPGGLALRLLLGYRPELLADRIGLRPLDEDRVVLVDARDLDPPEVEFLATARVRRRSVADLSADDLPDGPVLLHVDLDVVDAAALPGLRFPATPGPTVDAVEAAAGRIRASGRVVAVDLAATWAPGTPDPAGVQARLLTRLTQDPGSLQVPGTA